MSADSATPAAAPGADDNSALHSAFTVEKDWKFGKAFLLTRLSADA